MVDESRPDVSRRSEGGDGEEMVRGRDEKGGKKGGETVGEGGGCQRCRFIGVAFLFLNPEYRSL